MGEDNDAPRPGFDSFVSHKGQGKYFDTEWNIDGRSWRKLAGGDDPGWRTEWLYEYDYEKQFPYTPNVRGIRTARWKFVRYTHGDGSPDCRSTRSSRRSCPTRRSDRSVVRDNCIIVPQVPPTLGYQHCGRRSHEGEVHRRQKKLPPEGMMRRGRLGRHSPEDLVV